MAQSKETTDMAENLVCKELTADQARWNETEILLDRIEKNRRECDSQDILRLGELYTELISDLNKFNATIEDSTDRRRVNKLALRAYGIIYRPRAMRITDFVIFFLFEFPRLIKEKIHFILAAMLIFIFSSMIGYLCINTKSKLIDLVIPPAQQEIYRDSIKRIDTSKAHPSASEPAFGVSSYIMTNNIRVSAKAFATGIFLGVGTIFVLVLNGLLLGGLASIYTSGGLAAHFWSLILPHGGIELLCVFIAGGAGLLIGYSLLNPGQLKRRDSLIKEGGKAVRLMIGIVPLLVLAALIEAYITPATLPETVKFALSAIFFGSTIVWITLANIYEPRDLSRLFAVK
jgi:uncharacterized membrane protein SpoIIM required for sporulation